MSPTDTAKWADAIARMSQQLSEHIPPIWIEFDEPQLRIKPTNANGFVVQIQRTEKEFLVFYEKWHEHFIDLDEAIRCFLFGLTPKCRLRVYSRGQFDYKWVLEIQDNGSWSDAWTLGLLFFPFWRRRTERVLQNDDLLDTEVIIQAMMSG